MTSKYYPLGFYPTPFHRLNNLEKLFPGYSIYIKRDDLTGLAMGGNKCRKLEYHIWNAIQTGCDTVITAGAQQSNHCRQTAAAAALASLDCHLLLGGQPPENYKANLLLDKIFNAQIHFTGDQRKGEELQLFAEGLLEKGKKPYIIPYGGSDATGCLGYVRAAEELRFQTEAIQVKPDYIFFATSSGGTQAGLIAGKSIFNLPGEIIGINIDKSGNGAPGLTDTIRNFLNQLKSDLNYNGQWDATINISDEYDKAGYGMITENERNAISLLARTEGILLDPVYTGRAFHGMIDMLKNGRLKKDANVIFLHTGGTPAIFDEM
jgi:D-cysteine desulfhydrase family pyridoxal phosphate-dependent enzyme